MHLRALCFLVLLSGTVLPSAQSASAAATRPALSDDREGVAAHMLRCESEQSALSEKIQELRTELQSVQEALATPGMKAHIGPLLNERRRQLPDTVAIRRDIRRTREESTQIYARHLALHDQILHLKRTQDKADDLAIAEIQTLREAHRAYWRELAALNARQEELLAATQNFIRLIDENALWLPGARPLHRARFPASIAPSPQTWSVMRAALLGDVREHLVWYAGMAVLLAAWVAGYPRARAWDDRIRDRVQHRYADSFRLTVDALAIAVYRSAALPGLLWFAGNRMSVSASTHDELTYDFSLAIAFGLNRMALFLFCASCLRRISRRHGLAQLHFMWDHELVCRLHRGLGWLIWIGAPATFFLNLAEFHPDPSWRESVVRIAGVATMVAFAVFLSQLLKPGRRGGEGHRTVRHRDRIRYLAVLAIPLALAVAGLTTYSHTAGELGRHFYRTLLLALALVIARSLIARFVRVSRDRLAIEQTKHDRGTEAEAQVQPTDVEGGVVADDMLPSRETVDHQTTILLRWTVGLGFLTGLWWIWHDVLPALRLLGRFQLWVYHSQGGAPGSAVELQDLLVAVVAACLTFVLARNGPSVLETVLLRRLPLDNAARFAGMTILRYLVILVGLAITLSSLGLGWARVHWLAAGVTVGLGFGLQEIFANFISGLIILFERPVRIGDVVTVGGVSGKITRIHIRATTVTDWNLRELIVPNKEFITGQIINWSLSDPVTRVDIPVGIAYGANTRLARDLLVQVARECPHVLDRPAPIAIFKSFGESALDFELRVHIPSRDVWADMTHELHTRIDDEFRKAGIEIAFPQQDVHIRSLPDDFRPAGVRAGAEAATSPVVKPVRELRAESE